MWTIISSVTPTRWRSAGRRSAPVPCLKRGPGLPGCHADLTSADPPSTISPVPRQEPDLPLARTQTPPVWCFAAPACGLVPPCAHHKGGVTHVRPDHGTPPGTELHGLTTPSTTSRSPKPLSTGPWRRCRSSPPGASCWACPTPPLARSCGPGWRAGGPEPTGAIRRCFEGTGSSCPLPSRRRNIPGGRATFTHLSFVHFTKLVWCLLPHDLAPAVSNFMSGFLSANAPCQRLPCRRLNVMSDPGQRRSSAREGVSGVRAQPLEGLPGVVP